MILQIEFLVNFLKKKERKEFIIVVFQKSAQVLRQIFLRLFIPVAAYQLVHSFYLLLKVKQKKETNVINLASCLQSIIDVAGMRVLLLTAILNCIGLQAFACFRSRRPKVS